MPITHNGQESFAPLAESAFDCVAAYHPADGFQMLTRPMATGPSSRGG